MDAEELERNIRSAHAKVKEDIADMRRRDEDLKDVEGRGKDRIALSVHIVANEVVEATLARILGESRTLEW